MTYYWASTDTNGVLCVDEMEMENSDLYSEEMQVAESAEAYPSTIYFEYEKPITYRYYAVENDPHVGLCILPQGTDEGRAVWAAERNADIIFFGVEVIES